MPDALDRLSTALSDRYRLERELGQGGMATVYLAHDLRHDRQVAIKVLHEDLGATLGPERFLAEIKTTARLQHPHILPLLDSGSAGGLLFYVMPFVTGESLRDRLEREKQLPVEDALRITREVADALGHAHGHGIIHRDIKPENILLQGGHALVADFGIALAVQSAGGPRLTQTGLSLGTPQYMSPEQAMGERTMDARSDVYALGAVLYEMLTGEPPFTGATVAAVVAKVLATEPAPPTATRKTVPGHVEAAVLKALAKLPADRWGSAAEFVAGTTNAQTNMPRSARPSVRAGNTLQRDRIGILAGIGGLAALVVAGGMLWQARWGGPSEAVIRHIESYPLFQTDRWERRFALSPDGRQFAFVTAAGTGSPHIEIRNRDELRSTPVAGTEGAIGVFYSPDGSQIGFVVDRPLTVKTVRPGGAIATVAPVRAGISGGIGATWGSDGWIYLADMGTRIVHRYRPDGSAREALTAVDTLNGEWWHGQPEPLPNGKGVLFTIRMRNFAYRIAVLDLASGAHRVLAPGVRGFIDSRGHLLVVDAEGTVRAAPFDADKLEVTGDLIPVESGVRIGSLAMAQIAFSASGTLAFEQHVDVDSAAQELVWVAKDGSIEPLAPPAVGVFTGLSISRRDGRAAVADRGDIWLWQVGSARALRARLTTTGAGDPRWTPDGRSVSFTSSAGGPKMVLMTQRTDGSGPAALTLEDDELILDARWSPAGEWLAYREFRPSLEDIFATRPGLDSEQVVVEATPDNECSPYFSRDGRLIAYMSDASGQAEVYVRPFPDPGQWRLQVSTSGGVQPVWDPHTDTLYYFDLDGTLWAAAVRPPSAGGVAERRELFRTASWRGRPADCKHEYDIASAGDRFLMPRPTALMQESRVVFVEGFARELKGRLGR